MLKLLRKRIGKTEVQVYQCAGNYWQTLREYESGMVFAMPPFSISRVLLDACFLTKVGDSLPPIFH